MTNIDHDCCSCHKAAKEIGEAIKPLFGICRKCLTSNVLITNVKDRLCEGCNEDNT